jgi:uncharacterized DUF497 family protein
MALRFEWDPDKAESNPKRHHGITFDLAVESFKDALANVNIDRRENYGEERLVRLAMAGSQLLFVCYTERPADDGSGDEIIRIISARRATRHERRKYQED